MRFNICRTSGITPPCPASFCIGDDAWVVEITSLEGLVDLARLVNEPIMVSADDDLEIYDAWRE
jgi:hypothetical protein